MALSTQSLSSSVALNNQMDMARRQILGDNANKVQSFAKFPTPAPAPEPSLDSAASPTQQFEERYAQAFPSLDAAAGGQGALSADDVNRLIDSGEGDQTLLRTMRDTQKSNAGEGKSVSFTAKGVRSTEGGGFLGSAKTTDEPMPASVGQDYLKEQQYDLYKQRYQRNFSSWDQKTGSKGYLSSKDVDLLMQDPSIQGDDAATLATVKNLADTAHLGGLPDAGNLEFTPKGAHSTTGDEDKNIMDEYSPGIGTSYEDNRNTLSTASHQLFAHGTPDWKSVQQGTVGDCNFEAPLVGLAKSHPEAVKKMVQDNKDGTFTVNFPGGQPQTVKTPTDAEIAHYNHSGSDGMWATVIGKAYGQNRVLDGTSQGEGLAEPADGAQAGGSVGDGIRTLTGHDTEDIELQPPPPEVAGGFGGLLAPPKPAAPPPPVNGADLGQKIADTLGRGGLVCAGTPDQVSDHLPPNHVFTVLGYDKEHDMVSLRNPWGTNGHGGVHAPTDGQTDGTNDGMIQMPMANFLKDFSTVSLERQTAPVNLPGPNPLGLF